MLTSRTCPQLPLSTLSATLDHLLLIWSCTPHSCPWPFLCSFKFVCWLFAFVQSGNIFETKATSEPWRGVQVCGVQVWVKTTSYGFTVGSGLRGEIPSLP